MKKIISLIILCVMVMTGNAAYADDTPRISVSNASGNVGDIVKVNVSISNNPGIASYTLKLNFDDTKLTPEAVSGEGITSNIQQTGIDKSKLNYVTAVWDNASNMSEDGILFSVSFKIISELEDAAVISLSYSNGDICNQELEDVLILTSNGTISKPKKSNSEYTVSADEENIIITTNLDELDEMEQAQAMIIAAAYDENNVLLGVDISKDGATTTLKNNAGVSYIKIFIWDSNMRPLTTPAERFDL